jgi:hypothetical protein
MHDTADSDSKIQIARVLNSEEWIKKAHFKSMEEDISLEKQVILELIYSSEFIEKDTVESKRLKNKYAMILK